MAKINQDKDFRLIYILLCLFIPTAASYINPIMSLYLTDIIGLKPFELSVYYALMPVVTIIIVQSIAKLSDSGLPRPAIICISAVFGIISCFIFYLKPSAILLYTVLIPCYAIAQVCYAQIFASGREYSVRFLNGSIAFTTFLRSLASVAWVAGPPVSYFLVINISYEALFIFCSGVYGIILLISMFFLPDVADRSIRKEEIKSVKLFSDKRIYLFIATVFMFTAFAGYISTMPLFLTHQLGLYETLPGKMYSISAFLEIPIMLLCPRIARRISLSSIVMFGTLSLTLFLLILPCVRDPVIILLLSILPAIFIATVCTMGLVYFQKLLPKIPGQATSLFINGCTCGQITGGSLIGLATDNQYTNIHHAGALCCLISLILLCVLTYSHNGKV